MIAIILLEILTVECMARGFFQGANRHVTSLFSIAWTDLFEASDRFVKKTICIYTTHTLKYRSPLRVRICAEHWAIQSLKNALVLNDDRWFVSPIWVHLAQPDH
jgi:hypothetical protein